MFLVFFCLFNGITATKGQEVNYLDTMINNGLVHVINAIYGHYPSDQKSSSALKKDRIVFINSFNSSFDVSKEVIETEVNFVNMYELTEQQTKMGVLGISYSGAFLDENRLTLWFCTKSIILKGEILEISIGDGYKFEYEYSCESKKWILIED